MDNAYDVLQKITIPDVTAEEMLSSTPFLHPETPTDETDKHKEKAAKTGEDPTELHSAAQGEVILRQPP